MLKIDPKSLQALNFTMAQSARHCAVSRLIRESIAALVRELRRSNSRLAIFSTAKPAAISGSNPETELKDY